VELVRTKGRIATWNDEKGYGFISPLMGGSRTFVHINAFANRARRPAVGDVVTYSVSRDDRGRPCAKAANIAGVPKTPKPKRVPRRLSYVLAVGFLVLVGSAVVWSALPLPVLLFYLAISAATFIVYAFDKLAAEQGRWRIPEMTLHSLALIGGWPGALIAQTRFRHKTRKQPFRAVFWTTVVINGSALVWLTTPGGTDAWRSVIAAIA
jgi:uncharacterized membrane protein YsdA (DUF1294 family)/cold shock CspA family protein